MIRSNATASALTVALLMTHGLANASPFESLRHFFSEARIEGYIHFCGTSSGGELVEARPDGTRVSKGKRNTGNLWATSNPYIDGVENNIADGEFLPEAGRGSAVIRGVLIPTQFAGLWLNYQELTLSVADGDSSRGVSIGTGALLGRILLFTTGPVERDVDSPCGPTFSVPIKGRLIGLGRMRVN